MADATPMTDIREALKELRCISEIMAGLGRDAGQNDRPVPPAWMSWLGECVSAATAKAGEALDNFNGHQTAKELHTQAE